MFYSFFYILIFLTSEGLRKKESRFFFSLSIDQNNG